MNMQETMFGHTFLQISSQVYMDTQVRMGPNNLQNQTCAQASLKGPHIVTSSSSCNGRAFHSQLWVQRSTNRRVLQICFTVGIPCLEKKWLTVLLSTYKKMPHLRHRRYFVQHFYPSSKLAGWKRGLFVGSEKENLH